MFQAGLPAADIEEAKQILAVAACRPKPDTCLDFDLGCRVWGLREPQALNRGLVGFRFRAMDLGFL